MPRFSDLVDALDAEAEAEAEVPMALFSNVPPGGIYRTRNLPTCVLRRLTQPSEHGHTSVILQGDHAHGYSPGMGWVDSASDLCYYPLSEREQLNARDAALKHLLALSRDMGFNI